MYISHQQKKNRVYREKKTSAIENLIALILVNNIC